MSVWVRCTQWRQGWGACRQLRAQCVVALLPQRPYPSIHPLDQRVPQLHLFGGTELILGHGSSDGATDDGTVRVT